MTTMMADELESQMKPVRSFSLNVLEDDLVSCRFFSLFRSVSILEKIEICCWRWKIDNWIKKNCFWHAEIFSNWDDIVQASVCYSAAEMNLDSPIYISVRLRLPVTQRSACSYTFVSVIERVERREKNHIPTTLDAFQCLRNTIIKTWAITATQTWRLPENN